MKDVQAMQYTTYLWSTKHYIENWDLSTTNSQKRGGGWDAQEGESVQIVTPKR